ncbi:TipAS antibiotic-recognition domain-containing protein [Streptomyces deccanensis]|uniref:TipAS antibiotic-recognition domain-containing protein n=1 Tax=Streptomyces deccanensis TaxID=424188 RepID=UPI001EFB177A|nr:TipAS antibiotic-recognition domain-containing protein [Streptomyces deccanensis]ULR48550.1 TipAS antibiotic-recognition domain-containing protein [Streptomyces deccanensis]
MVEPKINRPESLFEGFAYLVHDPKTRERQSEQTQAEEQDITDRLIRMAEFMVARTSPDNPTVLEEVDWYYREARRYGIADAATFISLGEMYVDDPHFNALYERVAEGLAAYQRDAMAAYARARLS